MYTCNDKIVLSFSCNYAGEDSDFRVIPAGYINKTVCGCGLTSVAIESSENCIIAVPNVCLVVNKVSQYFNCQLVGGCVGNGRFSGEVFGVYGNVTSRDVDNYVSRVRRAGSPIKILATYDSLWKCEQYLRTDGCMDSNLCHLIVDECDKLLGYVSLKVSSKRNGDDKDAITYLLGLAERCKCSVSFISATPVDVSYLPEWVKSIAQIELRWSNVAKITPITMKRSYPFRALCDEVIMPIKKEGYVSLGDRSFGKVIVFINSVGKILDIIKDCGLGSDECGVICGDTVSNDFRLRGYNRIVDCNNLPRYTFVTSSGFQGIDLVDREAMNVVVSCTRKVYQMVDINTDLIQATSRQRDRCNPNFDRFVFIYNQNVFEKSEEELVSELNKVYDRINDNCNTLSGMAKCCREYESAVATFNQSVDFCRYTYKEDGVYVLNSLVFNAEKYQILETRKWYSEGFNFVSNISSGVVPIVVECSRKSRLFSYNSILQKYKGSIDTKGDVDLSVFSVEELSSGNFKIVDDYYKFYGSFSDNSYHAKNKLKCVGNVDSQFKCDVQHLFFPGRYTLSEIKGKLNEVYRSYGMKRKAKDYDLEEFGYEYKRVRPHGYVFIQIINNPVIGVD